VATVQTVPQLPTADELSDAWTKLADVQEHTLDPIMRSVFEALQLRGRAEDHVRADRPPRRLGVGHRSNARRIAERASKVQEAR
jgi:hypothetical protein